jgi:hypothetical protein
MSIRATTKDVVRGWAGVPPITNTLIELCVLWAGGHAGQPCGTALQPLIDNLKQAFPNKNLGGLRPSDMMGSGSIKTVESLIGFIASSPSHAQPFLLVAASALAELGLKKQPSKKGGKKPAKKAAGAGSKGSAKKGGEGGNK